MMKQLNSLICEIHNSPIGGVCSELSCIDPPFIMCIKCVIDPNFCIRKKNHKLTSIKEFFEIFLQNNYINDYKEIIQMYIRAKFINLSTSKESIVQYITNENDIFSELTKTLRSKLDVMFEKEKLKVIEAENNSIVEFKKEKELLASIQKNFQSVFDKHSVKNFDFKILCENLLILFQENKITLQELYTQLGKFITQLKHNFINCNNKEVVNALENFNFFISAINRPINTFKTELENRCKIKTRNIIEELNFYFKNRQQAATEGLNLVKIRSESFGSVRKQSVKANLFFQSSSKSSRGSGIFKKGKKKDSDQLKKVIEKNKYKFYSSFVMSHQNILPPAYLTTFSPIKIINDENVILIDKFDCIVFSNKSNFCVYDFEKKKEIFNLNLKENEEYYQKKYLTYNLNDVVFAMNSSKELLEIDLTDYMEKVCTHKFYKFGTELKEISTVFDISIEEDHLFGTNSTVPTMYIYLALSNCLQMWSIVKDTVNFVSSIEIEKKDILHSLKLELFEANFGSNSSSNNLNLYNSLSNDSLLNQNKKYLIHNNGQLSLYEVSISFTLYYKITSSYTNNTCNSFCLENLNSTGEAYLYSIWQNGSIFIHSLKNKVLVKEVKTFNIHFLPLYSICFISEKYVLIGGDNILFLVNHANEKSITKKWKEVKGRIIGIKMFVNSNNEENFMSVCSDGTINLWKSK